MSVLAASNLGRIRTIGRLLLFGRRKGSGRIAAASLALSLAGGASATQIAEPLRMQSTCLSVSPFRAIPALTRLNDTLGPEGWRDQVILALRRSRTDSAWFFRKAGDCPDSMATIDVFQMAGDVEATAQGQVMRVRLEWRHAPGQTEFFLPVRNPEAFSAELVSQQILVVAEQMLAMVEVTSSPTGASVRWDGAAGSRTGISPMVLLAPPGALSLELSHLGKSRRVDTLVSVGGYYAVHADFRLSRIDPVVKLEAPKPTWPLWALTLTSLLGGVWAAREQVVAQRAYDRLGADAGAGEFDSRWDNLRTANTLRNGFFSATVVFGLGTAWMEWSNARKN